jgi:anaphase-promoting complex subunit 4
VRILGPETNKTIYQFSTGDKTSGITCMGWACNRTSSSLGPLGSRNTLESLDELLFDGNLLAKRRTALNLPKDLAQIDIERSLPKLSVLPAGSNG